MTRITTTPDVPAADVVTIEKPRQFSVPKAKHLLSLVVVLVSVQAVSVTNRAVIFWT